MRIAVLEHEPESPARLFADWARDRGHLLQTLEVPALRSWPEPAACDCIVSLGSDCSVHASTEPWIASEISFMREAEGAAVPVLGICFGAQALAEALGGTVRRGSFVEAGWTELESQDPGLITPGPWFRWHEDVFDVPPGGRELARSAAGPLAFAHRGGIGLQFHPEVDGELVEAWIEGSRRELAEHELDERALRREVAVAAEGAPRRAFDLFDRVMRHLCGGDV